MIRVTPYYEWKPKEAQRDFERDYLRMVAAVVPFPAEAVLFDDPDGLKACNKERKTRPRTKGGKDTEITKLMKTYQIPDKDDLPSEAELAEAIIKSYSELLHQFLYPVGTLDRENLRALFLVKLADGAVPEALRFDLNRDGTHGERKKHAKALYEYVFPYDKFSKLKKTDGHIGICEFVSRLGVKVCPYCNRLFTTTVNTAKVRVRPQLDHFRNKNTYPFLALSVNNLIPTCGVCNLLKLDDDADLAYPYAECFADEGHIFATDIPAKHTVPAMTGMAIAEDDFEIKLKFRDEDTDTPRSNRIRQSVKKLALAELYQSHREHVSYLYRQRYILSREMAQDIFNQFGIKQSDSDEPNNGQSGALFSSVEEVEFLFTLMNTSPEHFGDHPLAKLTHDILAEIDELYAGKRVHP